jgi:hypothetical protein
MKKPQYDFRRERTLQKKVFQDGSVLCREVFDGRSTIFDFDTLASKNDLPSECY